MRLPQLPVLPHPLQTIAAKIELASLHSPNDTNALVSFGRHILARALGTERLTHIGPQPDPLSRHDVEFISFATGDSLSERTAKLRTTRKFAVASVALFAVLVFL